MSVWVLFLRPLLECGNIIRYTCFQQIMKINNSNNINSRSISSTIKTSFLAKKNKQIVHFSYANKFKKRGFFDLHDQFDELKLCCSSWRIEMKKNTQEKIILSCCRLFLFLFSVFCLALTHSPFEPRVVFFVCVPVQCFCLFFVFASRRSLGSFVALTQPLILSLVWTKGITSTRMYDDFFCFYSWFSSI